MIGVRRWARWAATAAAVLLLFWIAASVGGWSPDIRRLTTSVHGPLVADYRAESPQRLAPLSPAVTQDATRDQASAGSRSGPGTQPTGSPSPSGSGGPSPTASGPSLPPTPSGPLPSLPIATPTLPTATPTLPTATPTPVPTPSLPTPPPLP
jgi:hypothetical protein